ncbi:MAG: hypothetical protein LAT65_15775 [Saccharospirillum sp.]|nr:hypothetical protein [Saccharospirillum sp.]
MTKYTRKTTTKEIYFLVILLLLIISIDIAFRSIESRVSGNVKHIQEIPTLISTIDSSDSLKTIFMGNSLSNRAIDADIINDVSKLQSVKVVPDGTSLWDWQCIIRNQILNKNSIDVIVIGFAWNQLADDYPVNASRIGAYFCSWNDLWGNRAGNGLNSFDLAGEFVAAKVSHIYASREVLRNRVLSILIPEYESQTQRSNRLVAPHEVVRNGVSNGSSFNVLSKLIEDLKGEGTKVIVMAMPVRDAYQIDENLGSIVRVAGAVFLDYRNMPELDSSMFVDNMHLGKNGMSIFTRELSHDLQRLNIGD